MITPSDTPSSPSDYAGVATAGMDIQAPLTDIQPAYDAAIAEAGSGVLYPQGPRQQQTEQLIQSPQGFGLGGFDIDAGSAHGWPTNVEPGG